VQVGGQLDSDLTVVFVHGFLARTLEFDMQWNAFAEQARLVRYDHRNHGRSQHSRKPLTTQVLADDPAIVIEATAPRGPVVRQSRSIATACT
jgi:pimeloyl-ACP methyl ester carboxylesterase